MGSGSRTSQSTWERLEEFAREHVRQFIQTLLEEEVTELLGAGSRRARKQSMHPLDIETAMANLGY